ncbi:MAG: ABC transporter ATP-binding protein [Patescibacteria group bacterium]|nr:ABC transporter ATP-binding protein [Patescibacteria group bacterium]
MKSNEEMKFSWWDLVKSFLYLLEDKKKKYLSWLSALFLIQFYSIIPPLIVGKIVDFFTDYNKGGDLKLFYFYSIFLGGSFSLVSYIRLSIKRYLGNLRTDVVYNIRVKGFEKLLDQSLIKSKNQVAGVKAQKIENGSVALKTILQELGNHIFSAVTSVIGIFIVFIILKPLYIFFLLFYVFGFLAIVKFFYNKIQKVNYEFNKATEEGSGAYIEGLNNILTIKALGAKQSFGSHVAKKEEVRKKFEYLGRGYGIGQWIGFQVFNGICIAGFLFLIGKDVILGAITLGSIVIFYGYLIQLTDSAGSMLSVYENIIRAKTAIARMMPIFWVKTKIIQGTKKFPKQWSKIQLLKVTFDYEHKDKKENLTGISNINLSIKKNGKIGIVGKTGSGKSTLAKILLGLFPANSGKYQIDNKNFYDLKHEEVVANISLVLQETEMFNLSLKENISMMKNIDLNLFQRAVEISQLQKLIDKLPNGIDTLIGKNGYHLSGGEMQRVGIARAICRDSQILIFDEATSSLDNKTESLIQQGFKKYLNNKTLVYITHKISTLKNVDEIFVFEKGKIVEKGKFEDLLNNSKSRLAKFYKIESRK